MTGNKLLLDTSIVIEIFQGNKAFADRINEVSKFYISSIALGELYIGINRVSNKSKHLKQLEKFLKSCIVFGPDNVTAAHYGAIVAKLYKKGKPIPTNDIWIASLAIQHNFTLITMDKHFDEIEGLTMEKW